MVRKTTAYFCFMNEHRAAVRQELLDSAGEGPDAPKVGVAVVAKALGERWRALSEEDRAEFKTKCEALNAEAEAAAAEAGEEGGDGDAHDEEGAPHGGKEYSPLDGLLPLSNVRRILTADEDVSRVSTEGAVAIAAAVDLMLGLLVKGAASNARTSKRRTLQLKDFSQAVKQDRRFVLAGLRDVEAAVAEGHEAEVEAKALAAEREEEGAEDGACASPAAGEGEENEAPGSGGKAGGSGGKGTTAKGRGRPKGSGSSKAGKLSAKDKAALGTRAIDSFFNKRPAAQEEAETEA